MKDSVNIAVIGTGYVGLVSGACFSEMGHRVICVDNDENKIKMLKRNKMPIYEEGLEELVKKNVKAGRLFFTTSIKEAMHYDGIRTEAVFIAVGTPPRDDGSADLSAVEKVTAEVAENMSDYTVIVEKSTVPVETCLWIEKTMRRYNKKNIPFDVCSNPEFLKEGVAINDFLKPDRVVVGVSSERAEKLMRRIYKPLSKYPLLVCDVKSAELIKHASNSFLSTKISFINAVANLCEKTGANVELVAKGMGLDKRIGPDFLKAGIGFGGFCFPKDLEAFYWLSKQKGYDFEMLKEVKKINEEQKMWVVKKVESELWNLNGKVVSILGLAFKPKTDDMRFAPSIDIINSLISKGTKIKAYDPVAMDNAKKIFGNKIYFAKNPYDCVKDSDCVCLVTEWDEFKKIDFKKVFKMVKHPVMIDGRNLYNPKEMRDMGFTYISVGRP
ncbi:MAG TPA: UDP-glucose/GDP-mannose dehydrogenase family protein [Elusimicrobiales bacterium]|nr:UDP-glucose/GDP-mannose dehydrogenase family protein [Elusimicrobiales bacterium]HPO95846.1 UDP-glucose/GDP-mannose dehydrogenase family protein [Elusimicrobiales bacterium]